MGTGIKSRTQFVLICVSLLVLTLFNVFWLKQNYNEQKRNLQKDITNNFEKTVSAMQDSLIKRQVDSSLKLNVNKKLLPDKRKTKYKRPMKKASDSVFDEIKSIYLSGRQNPSGLIPGEARRPNTMSIYTREMNAFDSVGRDMLIKMIHSIKLDSSRRNIRIQFKSDSTMTMNLPSNAFNAQPKRVMFVSGVKYDSVITKEKVNLSRIYIKPNTPRKKKASQPPNVIINLLTDTLKTKEITARYKTRLLKQQITLPFKVEVAQRSKADTTAEIRAGVPFGSLLYQANFADAHWYLTQQIFPQILFSLFLITITGLSFWLIYRNLQKQNRLTALKNDFVSNITHELKTPIATVSVAIEALSNFNVLQNPTQTKEYLEISKNELNRLSILVDKVLKMSVFEQKELVLNTDTVNFRSLVESVLSTMKLQFEKCRAHVNFDLLGEQFEITGDSIHLTNVVYNLLENALKYSADPQINVLLQASDQQLQLSIKDNGIGISEEFLPKIFDKFFRVPTGNVHNIKGYGLGLSYVKNVVERHNGTIKVNSKKDEGSTFILALPLKV
ncbi:cell wall metabolism sensor histidine kinase WalK [Emticicia sp. 21SJ11W-3]|uniref:sensor histidine kinase n=1 Tax=Emticicia sp. 21SJ11W-3 TaxID=2916755 RepID=UPI00209C8BAF|nr:HAMP domain-containing sensor histidine kinase [Emticicia sp. 21SJ11W-3]UTA68900.1 HAMP domain-containing histidine kinase [Emticicia sp. 21SJ11W-3]